MMISIGGGWFESLLLTVFESFNNVPEVRSAAVKRKWVALGRAVHQWTFLTIVEHWQPNHIQSLSPIRDWKQMKPKGTRHYNNIDDDKIWMRNPRFGRWHTEVDLVFVWVIHHFLETNDMLMVKLLHYGNLPLHCLKLISVASRWESLPTLQESFVHHFYGLPHQDGDETTKTMMRRRMKELPQVLHWMNPLQVWLWQKILCRLSSR